MYGSPAEVRTIEYSFDPGQPVWIIQGCGSNTVVVEASVVRVIGVVMTSSLTDPIPAVVTYNVSIASVPTSTVTVDEVDMFHTLDLAVAEYKIRIT